MAAGQRTRGTELAGILGKQTLQTDPSVQLAQSQVARLLAFIESTTLARRKQALTDYGSGELAGSVLGERTTPGTQYQLGGQTYGTLGQAQGSRQNLLRGYQQLAAAQPGNANAQALLARRQGQYGITEQTLPVGPGVLAAQNNPFSTLANLEHGHEQATLGLNEAANKANLFYSSERGRQLGLLGRDYQQQQATEARRIQDYLTGLTENLAQAKLQATGDIEGALLAAYQRRLAGAGV